MAGHVVVATGVKREAACLAHLGDVVVVTGGGDAAGLRERIAAAAEGARGIASFGMAGALADGLSIGDWVIGDRLTGAIERACDADWVAALRVQLPEARVGGIFADGRMIDSVAAKLALGERYGALAVDMESHVAAAVAAERGLPFAVVRCISDTARHALPPAVAVAMRPDGSIDGGAMAGSLARRPGQLGDFIRTMAGFARAMGKLQRGARRMEPGLGCHIRNGLDFRPEVTRSVDRDRG